MFLQDLHTHNAGCGHALGTIEDYIKKAIEKNITEIGITDHFPYDIHPLPPEDMELIKTVAMSKDVFGSYIEEIQSLKKKYKDRIDVKISTEMGFLTRFNAFTRQKNFIDNFMDDIDYLLCGIHSIKLPNSPVTTITRQKDSAVFVDKFGQDEILLAYFNKMEHIIDSKYNGSKFFDVIAHFDNHRFFFLPENPAYSEKIWQYMLNLLDKIRNNGIAIEINTSGFWKGVSSQFPEDKILKEIIKRNINVTLSSDAHRPDLVAYNFNEVIAKVKKMGLTRLCSFEKREQILKKI